MDLTLRRVFAGFFRDNRQPPPSTSPQKPPPLNFLDGFLTGLLHSNDKLGLLQCGANDGVTVDPVRQFILRNPEKVHAVLVEPLPDIHALLTENYAGQEHVKALNLAIGPQESIELYRIKREYTEQYKGIIASGITSFNRDFVLRKATSQLKIENVAPEDRIEAITQQCRTVSQLLDDHADFLGDTFVLQIDAEGFDDEVVYTIDFSRHLPLAINYERENLNSDKEEKLKKFLAAKGYTFVRWNHSDELAVRCRQ